MILDFSIISNEAITHPCPSTAETPLKIQARYGTQDACLEANYGELPPFLNVVKERKLLNNTKDKS